MITLNQKATEMLAGSIFGGHAESHGYSMCHCSCTTYACSGACQLCSCTCPSGSCSCMCSCSNCNGICKCGNGPEAINKNSLDW